MSSETASHYEVLQVAPSASLAVIKASYRTLVQQYHPDRFQPTDEAERITKRLNEAYRVLSDLELRAEYDAYLASLKVGTPPSQPPQSPTPESAPEQAPAPAQSRGWLGWLAMMFLIIWSGHIGAGLLGGGAIPYMVGAGVGAMLYSLGSKIWKHARPLAKASLAVIWLAIVFSGIVVKQMRTPRPPTMATAPPSANSTPNPSETLRDAPQSTVVANPYSQNGAIPGEEYLDWPWGSTSDDQFNAGVSAWFQKHSEYNNSEAQQAINSHFQEVLKQYPQIALGPAIDMALQRALRAGRESEYQRRQDEVALQAARQSPQRGANQQQARTGLVESAQARRQAESNQRRSALGTPTQRPDYPTTQAEIDARNLASRAAVEDASKGNIPGASKRYNYRTGEAEWVDANGNRLE